MPHPGNRQGPQQPVPEGKPAPIGGGPDRTKNAGQARPAELHSETRQAAPAPPVDSKPSAEEVKATAASLTGADAAKPVPTGPRGTRITPAVPLPAALTTKAVQQTATTIAKQVNDPANAAALRDATQAARAAVAVAMAKLEGAGPSSQTAQPTNGNAMDNLTKKVNEMRVNAAHTGSGRGGRGRGGSGRQGKIEIPDSDFDFASSNAKFNKDEIVKEAAASPLGEAADGPAPEAQDANAESGPSAYNKKSSFFDNISSEAKDRAENNGQKPGGREWRGEEQRKNMETFGQGSVDGGYRNYRGRGRGRGGMRGRGGYGRGGRGNYRRTNDSQPGAQ